MAIIVVLEDMEDVAEFYSMCLSKKGHTVLIAHTCAKAAKLLAENEVDVLLTDYRLPDGTAASFLARCGYRIPKVNILVTGYTKPEHHDVFNTCLTKPIQCEKLCDVIQSHAGG